MLVCPWLGSRLACFGLVSGGIWAFFAFMPPCRLVFAWSLLRLVAGLFVRALSPIGFCSLAWPLCLGWPLGSLCPSARRCGALWVPVGCLGCCL